jgi:hypothetical protein
LQVAVCVTCIAKSCERQKLDAGALSQSDFDGITKALEIPKNTPHGDIAVGYRRKLMHHIRPSVDHAMFFWGLESREGEVMTDASGKVIRKTACSSRPSARSVSFRRSARLSH